MLLRFVGRVQGLIVSVGNPKQIAGLADLIDLTSALSTGDAAQARGCCLITQVNPLGIRGRQVRGYERRE